MGNATGPFGPTGSLGKGFDITPSGSELSPHTRAITVEAAGTVTGVLVNDGSTSHTTHALTPGILYPFAFKIISATTATSVKGYI